MLFFISIERTTMEESITTPSDKRSYQLEHTFLPHHHYHWLYIFTSHEQKSVLNREPNFLRYY